MSGDEQDQAILRIVKRRGELKKRKALIESELRLAGKTLTEIGSSLRHIGGSQQEWLSQVLKKTQEAPDICGLERVATMVSELMEIQGVFAELNQTAAELGID